MREGPPGRPASICPPAAFPRRTFAKTAEGVRLARLLNEACKRVPEHPTVNMPRGEEELNEPLPGSPVR